MKYKTVKIDTIKNIHYMLPEEVVDLYEAGHISQKYNDFVANIVNNAETIKPVEFDSFRGSFDLYVSDIKQPFQNIKTELADKISAIMSLYGTKLFELSNSKLRQILNDVLTLSQVESVYDTSISHNLGILNEDGVVSQNSITLASQNEGREKI